LCRLERSTRTAGRNRCGSQSIEKLAVPSPLILDVGDRCLVRHGERVRLSPKDFALLHYFAAQSGRVIPHAELLAAVWPDVHVLPDVLKVRVGRLRRILGDAPSDAPFITNVHGEGYRFSGQIVVSGAAPSGSQEFDRGEHARALAPISTLSLDFPIAMVVGRNGELAALDQFLASAANGTRQIVFVSGEPGIGKTTLIDLFLKRSVLGEGDRTAPASTGGPTADRARPWVGRGQCVEQYGRGEPFLPIMEALHSLAQSGPRDQLLQALRQSAPTWLAQLPSLLSLAERQAQPHQTNPPAWDRVLRELAEALEAVAAPLPDGDARLVVLVLEDLHWADPSTIDLLAVLARRRERARLLVLGSYRSGEPRLGDDPLSALLHELRPHAAAGELSLGPIGEGDVASYLAARFGNSISGEFARRLYRRSDGNPLFLTDIVRELIASGTIACIDGVWKLEGDAAAVSATTPISIRQLVARQRDRLPDEDRRLLEAASVAGSEFSSSELAAALEWDVADVEERSLRLADREQFLRLEGTFEWPDGTEAMRFRFLHEVYREIWRERVPASLRRAWHARIGECQERACGDAAAEIASGLAEHFERGGDYRRAVTYHEHASRQAVRQGARVEARAHLDQALRLLARLPDSPERQRQELRLQIDLGGLLSVTEGYASGGTEAAYSRARDICAEVGDIPEVFQTIFGLCRFFWMKGDLDTARDLAEQLLRIASQGNDPVIAMAAYAADAEVASVRGELERTTQSAERGLELVRAHWNDSLLVDYVYGHLGIMSAGCAAVAWQLLGFSEMAVRYREACLEMARTSGHPFACGLAYWGAAAFHQLRYQVVEVERFAEQLTAMSATHEMAEFFPFVELYRGWVRAMRGDAEKGAIQACRAAETLRDIGAGLFEPYAFGLAADCCGRAGQFDEALSLIGVALRAAARNGHGLYDADLHRLDGQLRLDRAASEHSEVPDDVADQAEACFMRAIEIARAQHSRWWALRATLALAGLWRRQGMNARARALVAAERAWFTEGTDTVDIKAAEAFLL